MERHPRDNRDREVTLGRPKGTGNVTQIRTPLTEKIYLPSLKNADQADDSFKEMGMCKVYPSVDFFAHGKAMQARAKEVCEECTVTDDCLWFSLVTNQQYGVWGGHTEEERRPMIKELLGKAA